ncbi:S8 family serine peptidase [Neobacillus niacini]|uniref:S8 family serine peptidase n=1 Tax=Neobacillus niacini TaxID=86668 RepID=UPI002FFE7933
MEKRLRLIPYQVNEVVEVVSEVPEGINMIGAPKIWEKSKGKGITVQYWTQGDITHPDLNERIIVGWNFTDDDNGNPDLYTDYNGHGTHVAGTIVAAQNNNGVIGVAPEASLLI